MAIEDKIKCKYYVINCITNFALQKLKCVNAFLENFSRTFGNYFILCTYQFKYL